MLPILYKAILLGPSSSKPNPRDKLGSLFLSIKEYPIPDSFEFGCPCMDNQQKHIGLAKSIHIVMRNCPTTL